MKMHVSGLSSWLTAELARMVARAPTLQAASDAAGDARYHQQDGPQN